MVRGTCMTYLTVRGTGATIFQTTVRSVMSPKCGGGGEKKKKGEEGKRGALAVYQLVNRGTRLNGGITVIGPFIYFECNSGRPSLFPIGRYYRE